MWSLQPEERISFWRNFRIDLQKQDPVKCLYDVAKFWSTVPQSNQFLAHDEPENWPGPWELIADNYYDDVGIALGIFYTLLLCEVFSKEDVMYEVLQGKNEIISIVRIGEHVLNYDFGNVVNTSQIDNEYIRIYQYDYKDLDVK